MTWKELKKYIEQMPPEKQTGIVMIWSEYDQPQPVKHFSKADENLYVVNGGILIVMKIMLKYTQKKI